MILFNSQFIFFNFYSQNKNLTHGVVDTLALEDEGVEGRGRADVGVPVADTPPSHTRGQHMFRHTSLPH